MRVNQLDFNVAQPRRFTQNFSRYRYFADVVKGRRHDQAFDPLWGRWARWSELLAYTVALENRPGEATNLHRFNVGMSCAPCEKVTLGADYHLLFSQHNTYGGRGIFRFLPTALIPPSSSGKPDPGYRVRPSW